MKYGINPGDIILDRYRILLLIGYGGEAFVAKAEDLNSGDIVAIKHLTAHATGSYPKVVQERFKRVAGIRFNHPHIVDVIDHGKDEGKLLLIMPYIEGPDLEKYMQQQGGTLGAEQASRILAPVASGLEAMHQQGFVHRDIKPKNILIDGNGDPKIIDLGILRDLNHSTITGEGKGPLGSPLFMAPEQITDPTKVGPAADIYALGATLYFTLCGHHAVRIPADSELNPLLMSICKDMPLPPSSHNPSIPPSMDAICMKMLAKNPYDRYRSAAEAMQAIASFNSMAGSPMLATSNAGHCTACGVSLPANAQFCHRCGTSLGPITAGSVFCVACGTQTGESSTCTGCQRPFSPSDHRFAFTTGPLAGAVFRIPEGEYYTGRKELTDRDLSISRRHLWVQCLNGTLIISDAGSANGTYLGQQPITRPTPLVNNSQLSISGNQATYSHH